MVGLRKLNGRLSSRLMTPARPPSIRSAVCDLYTLMRDSACAGMSCRSKLRPVVVKTSRPFTVVSTSGRPRTRTSLSSLLRLTETWTPGTRCNAAAVVGSGSLPMSSATIASTIWADSRLMSAARSSERRIPTTTISLPASCGASAVESLWAGSGCCA